MWLWLHIAVITCWMAMLAMAEPLGRSRYQAMHVRPEKRKTLKELLVWPNSYYDVPRYRYPYYDQHGEGKLVYGYGGRSLYKYSVFRPLEGFFK